MAGVVSKNPYDLLGDDDNSAPAAGVKGSAQSARGKADSARGAAQGARRGYSGSEAAFRDRNVGHDRNRGKPTEDSARGAPRGGYGARVRGGRGARHPRDRDDRHNKGPLSGSEKQAAHGWGGAEGQAELKDEEAGEQMAKMEKKEGEAEGAKEEEPAEPEEKQISYEEYLAQQAEKKLALESPTDVRKPNEGSKLDKKWANAKPLVKDEDEDFISASAGKAKRERERKTKTVVDIDQRYVEPDRSRGGRGGRGGGRGGPRGDARGGPRGGARGGRGGGSRESAAPINTNDQAAFPSLGK